MMVVIWTRREEWSLARYGGIAAGTTIAVSVLADRLTTFGREAELGFYGAAVQVIPIFLVALLLEVAVQFRGAESGIERHQKLRKDSGAKALAAQARKREVAEDIRKLEEAGGKLEGDLAVAATELLLASDRVVEVDASLQELDESLSRLLIAMRSLVLGYVAAAVPGETAGLYALAAGKSTTFLLLTTALSMVSMVALFVWTFLQRYKLPRSE
jgi:hypothetical protein